MLCIDYGGFDPWLHFEAESVPKIIKPKFVAEAASFALSRGWSPDEHLPPFNVRWRDGTFYVTRNPKVEPRRETADDIDAIRSVNVAAFDTPAEAKLVDALREAGVNPLLSMVADVEGRVVGHILFSPVQVVGEDTWNAVALGPMAVQPEFQNRGIGSQLVHAGLEACRGAEHNVVVVLGHPEYYPRFGFRRMSEFGLACEFEAPDEALMVAELTPGAIAGRTGIVHYHPLFKLV